VFAGILAVVGKPSSNNGELERRVTEVERRIEWLDQHGTRGVESLRNAITEQGKDIARVETAVDIVRKSIGTRQTFVYLAALLPVYILLFITIVQHVR
jgi:uncharacterized coiled-coil protein SlyX